MSLFNQIEQAKYDILLSASLHPKIELVVTKESYQILRNDFLGKLHFSTNESNGKQSFFGMDVCIEVLPSEKKFELRITGETK